MLLYHGTHKDFRHFALSKANDYRDFGRGIYLTASKEHALNNAKKHNTQTYYVRVYEVDMKELQKELKILLFKKVSLNWVKYVLLNRNEIVESQYDMAIGATADSSAQDILENFYRKHKRHKPSIKEYKELIKKLAVYVYPIQYCLQSPEAVKYFNKRCIDVIKYERGK